MSTSIHWNSRTGFQVHRTNQNLPLNPRLRREQPLRDYADKSYGFLHETQR